MANGDTKLDTYKKQQVKAVKTRKIARGVLDIEINRRITELFEKVIVIETKQDIMNSDQKQMIQTNKGTAKAMSRYSLAIITLCGLTFIIAVYFTFFY